MRGARTPAAMSQTIARTKRAALANFRSRWSEYREYREYRRPARETFCGLHGGLRRCAFNTWKNVDQVPLSAFGPIMFLWVKSASEINRNERSKSPDSVEVKQRLKQHVKKPREPRQAKNRDRDVKSTENYTHFGLDLV